MKILSVDDALSRSRLLIRQQSPYFSVLTLFAKYQFDTEIGVANTDGKIIRLNPDRFTKMTGGQQAGLLLHLTLHAALQHPLRMRSRDSELWNIACDIMVNHIIANQSSFPIPLGTLTADAIHPGYEPITAELVYEWLKKKSVSANQLYQSSKSVAQKNEAGNAPSPKPDKTKTDLRASALKNALQQRFASSKSDTRLGTNTAEPKGGQETNLSEMQFKNRLLDLVSPRDTTTQAEISQHWQAALLAARQADEKTRGDLPAGITREFEASLAPQLDWRTLLARFLIQTPTDFSGLDRRFIHRGLYIETLEQDSVHIDVAIDTSGSINQDELSLIGSELLGIVNTYPHIECHLYYCDTQIHGPYRLRAGNTAFETKGGGGTDFRPFFSVLSEQSLHRAINAAIYFTDGVGKFPAIAPEFPVMWVAMPGAPENRVFPFGEVIRMN